MPGFFIIVKPDFSKYHSETEWVEQSSGAKRFATCEEATEWADGHVAGEWIVCESNFD